MAVNVSVGGADFQLPAMALMILELTNAPVVEHSRHEHHAVDSPVLVTTKGAYRWGAILVEALRQRPDLSEREIATAFRRAFGESAVAVKEHYADALGRSATRRSAEDITRTVEGAFVRELGLVPHDATRIIEPDLFLASGMSEAEDAYSWLIGEGLIEDPFELLIAGLPVAALGFLPIGWTQRKHKGQVVYRKVSALFWSYEQERKGTDVRTNLSFRLLKALRSFGHGLIEAADAASLEGPADSPSMTQQPAERAQTSTTGLAKGEPPAALPDPLPTRSTKPARKKKKDHDV
jgi:hypothetical protein